MICSKCKITDNSYDAVFCHNCGAKLGETIKLANKPGKSSFIMSIIAAVFTIIAVGNLSSGWGPINELWLFTLFMTMILAFVAFIIAIVGMSLKYRKKGLAIAGFLISIIIVIIGIITFVNII